MTWTRCDGLVMAEITMRPNDMTLSSVTLGLALALAAPLLQVKSESCGGARKFFDGIAGWSEDELLKVAVHRSGEVEPCAVVPITADGLAQALSKQSLCDFEALDKYDVDRVLTSYVLLHTENECGPMDDFSGPSNQDFSLFCDAGPDRTPIQPDHMRIKAVTETNTLPCRFYNREGRRLGSIDALSAAAKKAKERASSCQASESLEETCSAGAMLHVSAVPAGRVFMLAPSHVGEKFVVDHVPEYGPIVAEVLSVEPRIFELHGFFTEEEGNQLIQRALSEVSKTHKLHRSTTGAVGGSVYNKRTSENAWNTHTKEALKIKKRCMAFLGFDSYWESHTDGLQVLRYEVGQAYSSHADYLDGQAGDDYNYDSSGVGGNRFATILLYMSDLGEKGGGETLFDYAWPVGTPEETISSWSMKDAMRSLRDSGDASALKPGSWEERMVAVCRSRLSVKPKSGRAVLFYSQRPDGEEDKTVLHGACPVLNGTKWAANLWAWSAPRASFPGAPKLSVDSEAEETRDHKLAVFMYTGADVAFKGAEVYWEEDQRFGTLGTKPISVKTFEGHKWTIKKDGDVLKTIVIGPDPHQVFKL